MLIFELARLGDERQPVKAGHYEVEVRLSDQGDCWSTVHSPHQESSLLSVEVFPSSNIFPLDEPGRATSVILDDLANARVSRPAVTIASKVSPFIATLFLLRYDSIAPKPNALWVLQRQLRQHGVDICFDGPSVWVGTIDEGRTRS